MQGLARKTGKGLLLIPPTQAAEACRHMWLAQARALAHARKYGVAEQHQLMGCLCHVDGLPEQAAMLHSVADCMLCGAPGGLHGPTRRVEVEEASFPQGLLA